MVKTILGVMARKFNYLQDNGMCLSREKKVRFDLKYSIWLFLNVEKNN